MLHGEVLSTNLANKYSQEYRVVHSYGFAETSSVISNYLVKDDVHYDNHVPIGKPINKDSFYILNENLHKVCNDEIGEIHIGRLSLADNYLGSATQFEQRFISNPYRNGEKLFKTGDFAKFRDDGTVILISKDDRHFINNDQHVKLYDVEFNLMQHPLVDNAAVTVTRDKKDVTFLTAYVAIGSETGLSTRGIRSFMKLNLPSTMIPQKIHLLDRLPLTKHAKIDYELLKRLASAATTKKILVNAWY